MIDEAESRPFSAFSFSQEEIDHVLLLGSNTDEARKIVALEYMKQKSAEEIALTLKQVYHGGYGLKEDSGNISAWYAGDGIHLARASSAIDSPRARIIPWEDAAKRIGELLENGTFATNVELAEASGFEHGQAAQSLWYLCHDLSGHAKEQGFLSSLREIQGNGFPEETAWLAEQLADPAFLTVLRTEYQDFLKAHGADRSLLRFHYHKLDVLAKRLNELDMPLREYRTDRMQMPVVRPFITDDEINQDLARGSGFSGGKRRIYEYWQENHSVKEKADFLKKEYGTGGHSHALSGATYSGQDHDARGVRYHKNGCDHVQMSWEQVAQRIDSLMEKGRFLTLEEEAERQAIEDAKANPLEDVYERFSVIETDNGYAVWDDARDEIYLDADGVQEEFASEWQAEDYLKQVRTDVANREAAEWLSAERSKAAHQEEIVSERLQGEDPVLDAAQGEELSQEPEHDLSGKDAGEPAEEPVKELTEEPTEKPVEADAEPEEAEIEPETDEDKPEDENEREPVYAAVNGELQKFPDEDSALDAIEAAKNPAEQITSRNFRITDDHLGEGGPKQKFRANIMAIQLLKKCEEEHRPATPEEQKILSGYVGWGGLADVFDEGKDSWATEYLELKTVLTPAEYEAARASTLNAHYTSPTVIRAIYEAVGKMGFTSGNVLDESVA